MKCAIVYDFDGTLAQGNCAEHGLMDALGIDKKEQFWSDVKRLNTENDGDEILTYMALLAHRAHGKSLEALSPLALRAFGAGIPLFEGVKTWFTRINKYASELDIKLEHYIISSGLEEMILGSAIGGEFKKIFGCRFETYSDGAQPYWPSQVINYTTKTQFLFRINKGILNSWDNDSLNTYVELYRRPIPFERMVFLGDGDTDIPSMKMVRHQGGYSIAVFDEDKWDTEVGKDKAQKLISEERANYVVPADYREGSQLDVTLKGVLQLIHRKTSKSKG